MDKPFSQSCENNKRAILAVLKQYMRPGFEILEIGSGTGQHALYFANECPDIIWQPSDKIEHHNGILQWRTLANHHNMLLPIVLDVNHKDEWPAHHYHMIYTANTAHIMSWPEVLLMMALVGVCLDTGGLFMIYGPFNLNGQFTSESNRAFDAFLRKQKPTMGLRDVDAMEHEASKQGLALLKSHDMPANNKILVFKK